MKVARSPYVVNVWADALPRLGEAHTATVLLSLENIVLFWGLKAAQRAAARKWKAHATLIKSVPTALLVVILNIVFIFQGSLLILLIVYILFRYWLLLLLH